MKIRHLAGIFLAFSLAASGQEFDRQKLDSLLTHIDSNDRGMFSLSIFKYGREVYQRAIGFADLENRVPAGCQTVYRVGSITKPFTAAIIMKLVEEGELKLDDRLRRFYPGIENAGKITLEMMLAHRSGIFNFTSDPDYLEWRKQPVSREELLAKISGHQSAFEPGEKMEYSNANYVLLSMIAEEVTGKSYPSLLREMIAEPLGLENTYYGGPIDPGRNEAFSYEKEEKWERTVETDMSIPLGAGGVASTPTDLNRFLQGLFTGRVVSEETLRQMTEYDDRYGLGLMHVPFYDRKAIGHNGGIDGFVSMAYFFPGDSVSFAIISNGQGMALNDIVIGVLSIYYGRDYQFPEFKSAVPVTPEELEPYPGVYSSPMIPIKLTITRKGNRLFGQGTGQPEFPLEAVGDHTFVFEQASIRIVFRPEESKMILHQGGAQFEMTKEEE